MNNTYRVGLRATVVWILLMFLPAVSGAVQVEGMGTDKDHAVTNALQVAVEQVVGVTVDSSTDVVNFQVIKDEIITHSRGYVSSYTIVKETKDPDGGYTVLVDATVNKGQVEAHAQTMEILMKMVGHPRILIFGDDSGIDAVPSGTEIFNPLVETIAGVFRDTFKFEVIDWPTMREQYKDLPGKLDREVAIKNRSRLKADYYVAVDLSMVPDWSKTRARLTLDMKGVRISDGHLLGEASQDVGFLPLKGLKPAAQYRRAVEIAKKDVFVGAGDIATALVAELQSELERGKGFRYTVGFYDFPDQKLLEAELAALDGYVRHGVDKSGSVTLQMSYWSNMQTSDLADQIKAVMQKHGYKVKFKQDGRVLKFKWENPEGF